MATKRVKRSKRPQNETVFHHKALLQSLFYVVVSLLLAFFILFVPPLHQAIVALANAGYIGAFIAGIFIVSVFTAAPAVVVLLVLAQSLPILPLAIVAGLGAVIGDILILLTLRQGIENSKSYFPKEFGLEKIVQTLRHTKYRFLLTLLGAVLIASPLPDELGLACMGLTDVSPFASAILTFVLNTAGMYFFLMIFK